MNNILIEQLAKLIYYQWEDSPGYVEWVEGGNSFNQEEARRLAKSFLLTNLADSTALHNEVAILESRVKGLEKEVMHWKANHAHEVERARLIKIRPDLPLERISAYDRCALDKVIELETLNRQLLDMQYEGLSPNTYYYTFTNKDGKPTSRGSRTCFDSNRDSMTISAALELRDAKRRGVDIDDATFVKHVVGPL
jgi:hypothetical protein